MKGFLKVVVWIVILGAILFGVYMVVPEYPHNFAKSIVQPIVDSTAKTKIGQVKALTNKDLDNATYQAILEAKTKSKFWVYETRDAEPGVEYVIFYGNGVTINLKDYEDYNGKLSTSASVKIEFKIVNNNVEIYPYVDDVLMNIQDGAHVEQNDRIKRDILQQLYTGMQLEK
ncbi:MAG: hypothetical protein K2H34_04430 [Lachnospiraceae bacterium]|nr:hypothetical protein [Lachnospiraceae bacterium]